MVDKNKKLAYLFLFVYSFCVYFVWVVNASSFSENLEEIWVNVSTFSDKKSISRYEVSRLLNAANCEDCIQASNWMRQTYNQNFWDNFTKIDWKDFGDIKYESAIWNKKSYYYCVAYVGDNGYMAWYPETSTKCQWSFCGQEPMTMSEFYQTVLNIIQDKIKQKYQINWQKVKSRLKWLKKNSIQMRVLNQTNIDAINKADSNSKSAKSNDEFQAWLKYCMYNLSDCWIKYSV